MVGQTVLSILDEAAAAIGGWTALQSIRCVHLLASSQHLECVYEVTSSLSP